jgi:hypothetical protein
LVQSTVAPPVVASCAGLAHRARSPCAAASPASSAARQGERGCRW